MLDALDLGRWRPSVEEVQHLPELLGCAFGNHFDRAVGLVAHIAGDIESAGLLLSEVAVAHALDAPGYNGVQPSLSQGLLGCGGFDFAHR